MLEHLLQSKTYVIHWITAKNKLTHLFSMHLFSTPWKYKKSLGFLMLSRGRERVHWEQMGQKFILNFIYRISFDKRLVGLIKFGKC